MLLNIVIFETSSSDRRNGPRRGLFRDEFIMTETGEVRLAAAGNEPESAKLANRTDSGKRGQVDDYPMPDLTVKELDFILQWRRSL